MSAFSRKHRSNRWSKADYQRTRRQLLASRRKWLTSLHAGRRELASYLEAQGYHVLTGRQRQEMLTAQCVTDKRAVALTARLKRTGAILEKMARFGESLDQILDVWGYRIVVADVRELDRLVRLLTRFWDAPRKEDLLLRDGRLPFDWLRDYRLQRHLGLSESSSPRYDEAIHINRKAPFGISEIQVMTVDLFRRAYASRERHEAHSAFVKRRLNASN